LSPLSFWSTHADDNLGQRGKLAARGPHPARDHPQPRPQSYLLISFFPLRNSLTAEVFLNHSGFLDHIQLIHIVGLLWTSDQPVAEASTYTGQHNIETQETNVNALSGIQTRDPSNQAAVDLRLSPHGYRGRLCFLTNSVAQDPEGSPPHSQQPATGPCPEPVESNPHPPSQSPKIHSDPIFPPTPWTSKWSLSFGLSSSPWWWRQ
jgi:hypothetical protein